MAFGFFRTKIRCFWWGFRCCRPQCGPFDRRCFLVFCLWYCQAFLLVLAHQPYLISNHVCFRRRWISRPRCLPASCLRLRCSCRKGRPHGTLGLWDVKHIVKGQAQPSGIARRRVHSALLFGIPGPKQALSFVTVAERDSRIMSREVHAGRSCILLCRELRSHGKVRDKDSSGFQWRTGNLKSAGYFLECVR